MMEQYINKIIHADCMDILKQLPDKCIDAIICDLPYGTTACSWDNIIPFDKLWEQYKRLRKDNTPIVLFGSEPFSTYLRMSNIKEYKYDWYWNKTKASGHLNAKKQPMRKIENICVFYVEQCRYNPQGLIKGQFNNNRPSKSKSKNGKFTFGQEKQIEISEYTNFPNNVLDFSNPNNNTIHSTQKPVKLLEYLIKTYSNEGDLILDNCSGSGTTAVACHNLNRRFICIEKDYDYWKASVERLENAKSQLNLFTNIEQPKEEITEQAKLF
jgi:site-specific DNA-methyltransferase (adenine-specific)